MHTIPPKIIKITERTHNYNDIHYALLNTHTITTTLTLN